MIEATDIHSLTEFQRNARDYVERLKRTGKPEVLTINGEAEIVVQSAESYRQLALDAELVRSLRVIRKSVNEAKAGKGRPMKQFLEELAAQHGVTLGDG